MKINKLLLAGMTFSVMAFTACVDDPEYTPAEPIANPSDYYFSTNDADVELEVGDEDTKFTVMVYRAAAGQEATVEVNTVKNSDLFTVPASVTFAADATSAPLDITFTPSELDRAADYTFTFTVAGQSSDYYVTESKYLVNYVTWIPMVGENGETTGIWVDDIMTGRFGVDILDNEVQILVNPQLPGIYCVVNPYNAENWPYFPNFTWVADGDVKIYFNCIDPEHVFPCDKKGNPVEFSGLGVEYNESEGELGLCSLASYYLLAGNETNFNNTCGILKAGNIIFPESNSLMLSYHSAWFDEGSGWWTDNDGKFAVILPGYEYLNADVWELLGEGTWTDGFVSALYPEEISAEETIYPVQVEQLVQEDDETVIYRMVNPYLAGVCPFGQEQDKDYYIKIDATNPQCVILEEQQIGMITDDYGEISILNYAWILKNNPKLPQTDEQIIAAGNNDELVDGTITFNGKNSLWYLPLINEDEYTNLKSGYRNSVLVLPNVGDAQAVSYATKAAGKLSQPKARAEKSYNVVKKNVAPVRVK